MNKTTEQRIEAVSRETFRGYLNYIHRLSEAAKQHYREDPETFDLSAWTEKMLEQTPYNHCIVAWTLKRWYCVEEFGYDPYYADTSEKLTEIDFNKEVKGIGTKTANNIVDFIEDNNIHTKRQLLTELCKNLDSVSGLGEQNMTNLEDYFDLPDQGSNDSSGTAGAQDAEDTVVASESGNDDDGSGGKGVLAFDYTSVKGLGPSTQSNIHDFIQDRGLDSMSRLLDELEQNLDEVTGMGPTTMSRLRKKAGGE